MTGVQTCALPIFLHSQLILCHSASGSITIIFLLFVTDFLKHKVGYLIEFAC